MTTNHHNNPQEHLRVLATARANRGEELYAMASSAHALLNNRDWVDDPAGGGGDEAKALRRLEDDFFADIAVSLVTLLTIFQHLPFKAWQEAKFNLRALSEKLRPVKPEREAKPQTVRTSPDLRDKIAHFSELAPAQAKMEFERAARRAIKSEEKAETLQEEVVRLREENRQLRAEIADLKQRIRSAVA